ncbi:MAG: thiamine biosynthesis protein ThiS [Roseibacillus sp.]|nr:thiamine biosynthesis protein ThiS [Roseibacillus sp.]HCQ38206.1 thiamine biosynthesis protein ThiS [Verrucomicrobiales bacterium]|tara:strand:+ start:282 stop:482 length:201 start_codon:yes stop_codon:yes gene_type:complete
MTITLNGDNYDLKEGSTVSDLLNLLNLLSQPIVTELDGQALTRHDYASSILLEGSRVEVIRLAAGG